MGFVTGFHTGFIRFYLQQHPRRQQAVAWFKYIRLPTTHSGNRSREPLSQQVTQPSALNPQSLKCENHALNLKYIPNPNPPENPQTQTSKPKNPRCEPQILEQVFRNYARLRRDLVSYSYHSDAYMRGHKP